MQNKKVLFVCLGNICRSPAAEAILKKYAADAGLEDKIYVESAGTAGYHIGEPADPRMVKHAAIRGYNIDHEGRKFRPSKDFIKFDYIITMDNDNYEDISALDNVKKFGNNIFKMTDFCKINKIEEIPDPYYEGPQGFDNVITLLEDGCAGVLERIRKDAN
ncbi:MAG TPA: low molecular weight protein-tyrosine-phosphatase [Ignavibacteriaceae bacterium]|nr:low molecular weight protein-tyrosine-phosphatase [Ignavibacteriaceae bacterium]